MTTVNSIEKDKENEVFLLPFYLLLLLLVFLYFYLLSIFVHFLVTWPLLGFYRAAIFTEAFPYPLTIGMITSQFMFFIGSCYFVKQCFKYVLLFYCSRFLLCYYYFIKNYVIASVHYFNFIISYLNFI